MQLTVLATVTNSDKTGLNFMLQELTGLCKPNFTVIGGELCLVDINLKGKLFKRRKKLVYEIFFK